jgi:hypothetical protein
VREMLDAFIIEEIKRRERARQERDRRPVIELPVPPAEPPARRRSDEENDKPPRSVVIIDLSL